MVNKHKNQFLKSNRARSGMCKSIVCMTPQIFLLFSFYCVIYRCNIINRCYSCFLFLSLVHSAPLVIVSKALFHLYTFSGISLKIRHSVLDRLVPCEQVPRYHCPWLQCITFSGSRQNLWSLFFLTSALDESALTSWASAMSLLRLFLCSLLPPSISALDNLAHSGDAHRKTRLD